MAPDVTDTIRNGFAAWSRGDVEGALAGLAPQFEFETSDVFPGLDPVYRGHDGVRRFFEEFNATWEDIAIDVAHIVPGRAPLVAVAGGFNATGRDGIHVNRRMAWVFTTEGDVVTRLRSYGTWEEAFEAAGVPAEQRAG
jgi:ketosteroid isomerase-like protein